ncbi:cell division protein FtsQ [Jatrophihabitans endophyticus]|uniref:Cell division protein FtsQ n=1 Tax=Jatrophihabitans endophyticus TaxID=1206085 RepID=A0A1M5LA26_9ACTN|nr:FtsQ-type POTRA domain-containing protein [Jatrophihabitans endophyticus]SHG61775.1 cell division protein FtsQ [Jatrophihabitans endophyticus]
MTATEIRRAGAGGPGGFASLPAEPAPRRRRRVALIVALLVVFAAFATWLVAFSPVFGVRTVTVHGVRALTTADVERAADVDYGQPVVRVDTAAIAARVETLPQVESARVSTSFPSTVVVTVTERVAVGYVTIAGRRILVDRGGEQYLGVDKAPGLPQLVVPSGSARHTTGSAVATVAASLPADLRARTKSIEALDPDAITLVLRDGVLVRWGSEERSATKARVADVLRQRKHPRPSVVDVTDPDRPYTR